MSLDKVLRLAGESHGPEESSDFIRAAADRLNELALLLAKASGDDDEDGDDDKQGDDEDDNSFAARMKARRAKGKKKSKGKGDMAKCSSLVLEAMVALSHLQGGETVSLSVLDTADRKKASAHTIPGTTDYPIPDKGHLAAAIARYKQGALAGHSAAQVKSHIMSRARALGVQVSLSELEDPASPLVQLAFRPDNKVAADQLVAMDHGPHIGRHRHPYRSSHVVNEDHYHNADSRHSGDGY